LRIQEYLRGGKTPEDLKEELGIRHYRHPEVPLIGFKYSQFDSPKTHPIVLEARGIVLEEGTWDLVAKGFDRFFNVGELEDEFKLFDWSNFTVQSKEDGSLILLYWYDGEWRVNTSGSFGFGEVHDTGKVFGPLFWEVASFKPEEIPSRWKDYTLVFELCTLYNKVVLKHTIPKVVLLSVFDRSTTPSEFEVEEADYIAEVLGVPRPAIYNLSSLEEIREWVFSLDAYVEICEGVVLRDCNGQRWKWKTKRYGAAHHLKDNGNILLPKNLVPICLMDETAEMKVLFPECANAFDAVSLELIVLFEDLSALWEKTKHLESQKDFALAVKSHPMASMLFSLRKERGAAPISDLRQAWRRSDELITKRLYADRRFEYNPVE